MATTRNFRLLRRFLAPSWLTDEEGELVGYSLDLVKDAWVERLRLGHRARFPQQDASGTPGPADALAAMGRDRRVVRGINESLRSYASRLKTWLDDKQTSGGAFALMQRLAEYTGAGVMFRTVDVRGNWYKRTVDNARSYLFNQGNWNWGGSPTDGNGKPRWSRFWVVVYPGTLWTAGSNWGETTWGDTTQTWGCTATADQVATMRFLANDGKPGGTRCVNIILALDPTSFDPATPEPDGTWEHWSKVVAGVRVPARLATARYWDGK